jgi:ATP-dependent Clp protease ATP-binding subunit ClpA
MDHGKLTDHNGKQVDFRNVILIMTTNAGAAEMEKAAIGFGRSQREGDDTEAINRLFAPEFRNRLDAIVPFANLPPAVVHQVVQKFVLQLEAQLADRGVTFDLSEGAVKWLSEKGYDQRMGARPLARVIQEHIKQPLADEVLFGKLKKGGTVKVTVKDDGSDLALEAIADGPVTPKPEPEEAEGETPAAVAAKKPRAKRPPKPPQAKKPSGEGNAGGGKRGLVPKVPLKTN